MQPPAGSDGLCGAHALFPPASPLKRSPRTPPCLVEFVVQVSSQVPSLRAACVRDGEMQCSLFFAGGRSRSYS